MSLVNALIDSQYYYYYYYYIQEIKRQQPVGFLINAFTVIGN